MAAWKTVEKNFGSLSRLHGGKGTMTECQSYSVIQFGEAALLPLVDGELVNFGVTSNELVAFRDSNIT